MVEEGRAGPVRRILRWLAKPSAKISVFALLAFGYLFGFVGLLLAVPLAAALGVLTRFAIGRYRASAFYTGNGPT